MVMGVCLRQGIKTNTMPKYFSSPTPEFDTVFETLSEQAQLGVCASGMPLSQYFMMFVDDPTAMSGESFAAWMDYHFCAREETGVLANIDPVLAILALDGSPGAEGTVPESDLADLGKVAMHST